MAPPEQQKIKTVGTTPQVLPEEANFDTRTFAILGYFVAALRPESPPTQPQPRVPPTTQTQKGYRFWDDMW